ncbi:MAG: type VI secretion system ATPase TssH, partial [Pseudomonadota bacterium]|nr:type VI secretion system ATPase TssH [Pseudomonadota bacterium]
EQLHEIARIQIGILAARLAARDLTLRVTDAALNKLSDAGFDPVYGARPLKRTIQTQLENPLAQEILSGRFGLGDTIVADVSGSDWVFRLEKTDTTQVA